MISIHANRRSLGVFLLFGGGFTVAHLVLLQPFPLWAYVFMAPVYAGVAWLAYVFFANPPLVTIGEGSLTVHRRPLAPIQIPLSAIRTVRYRRLTQTAGEGRVLEVALRHHTPQTEKLRRSFWHRQLLKENSWYGGYSPPEEPYVILQTLGLDVSESEFADLMQSAAMDLGA